MARTPRRRPRRVPTGFPAGSPTRFPAARRDIPRTTAAASARPCRRLHPGCVGSSRDNCRPGAARPSPAAQHPRPLSASRSGGTSCRSRLAHDTGRFRPRRRRWAAMARPLRQRRKAAARSESPASWPPRQNHGCASGSSLERTTFQPAASLLASYEPAARITFSATSLSSGGSGQVTFFSLLRMVLLSNTWPRRVSHSSTR